MRSPRGPRARRRSVLSISSRLPTSRRPFPPISSYLNLLREITDTNSFFFASGGYELTNSLQRCDAAAAGGAAGGATGAAAASVVGGAAASAAASSDASLPGAGSLGPAPALGAVLSPPSGGAVDASLCDEAFFWNKRALSSVLAAGPRAGGFVTPVINGLVLSSPCELAGTRAELLLISRRACARQGTRFNMRGVDAAGAAANYVETEQLLLLADGAVASFVQVRGSVPLLWEQPASLKYAPRAVLRGAEPVQRAAFARHMQAQRARYGGVTAVNLIDKKKDQLELGEAYTAAVARLDDPQLHYVWFDFHHECRSRWENLRKLVDLVEGDFLAYGCVARGARGRVGARRGAPISSRPPPPPRARA